LTNTDFYLQKWTSITVSHRITGEDRTKIPAAEREETPTQSKGDSMKDAAAFRDRLKQILKPIPRMRSAYHFAARQYQYVLSKVRTPEDIFTDIYRGNKFCGTDSVSGPGSDLFQTRVVRNELITVCHYFAVHVMLDIPCGDFHWMKHVDLEGIDYIGADIVMDLIQKISSQYEASNIHFRKLNLMHDKLPKVDLVFCRDCLVHLSFKDAFTALHNMCDSGSTYLLTTTFTSRAHNRDIATGQWRTLNLEVPPFSFPPPLKTVNEECSEGDGAFRDKSLALWRVEDIGESLTKHST